MQPVSTPPSLSTLVFDTFGHQWGEFNLTPLVFHVFRPKRGEFSLTPHVFHVFRRERGGFNLTPLVFHVFRHERGGFSPTPLVFDAKGVGSTPPCLFSTRFDPNGVSSTSPRSFSMPFDTNKVGSTPPRSFSTRLYTKGVGSTSPRSFSIHFDANGLLSVMVTSNDYIILINSSQGNLTWRNLNLIVCVWWCPTELTYYDSITSELNVRYYSFSIYLVSSSVTKLSVKCRSHPWRITWSKWYRYYAKALLKLKTHLEPRTFNIFNIDRSRLSFQILDSWRSFEEFAPELHLQASLGTKYN